MEDDGFLEDMKFDSELDGFFAGTGGTVNLQPQPMFFGVKMQESTPLKETTPSATGTTTGTGTGAGAAAAAIAAFATFVGSATGGRFGMSPNVLGDAVGNLAATALPSSLQNAKGQVGSFLSKAQPWREFVWPLSVPPASQGCSRITANVYNFQTNYAILFVVMLVMSIIMQPSALICIGLTILVWVLFLKKNDDPEWAPTLGGVALSPMQRWLLLAATTALVLLIFVGGTIFNAALMFVLFAIAHGIVHDPSAKGVPGEYPVPI